MRRRKRNNLALAVASEWDRVLQIVRVEEPISEDGVRRFCRDLKAYEVERVIADLLAARKVTWDSEGRLSLV